MKNETRPPEMKIGELTVIASETKITGTVETRSELHFYGQIHGTLRGHPGSIIHIKSGSLVDGKVEAENLIVEGFVNGEIHCSQKVWITPQGRVVGTVQTATLQVDPGAIFEANVEMS